MWPGEDEEGGLVMPDDDEDDKGMSKRELVDGLIGAVSALLSPSPMYVLTS